MPKPARERGQKAAAILGQAPGAAGLSPLSLAACLRWGREQTARERGWGLPSLCGTRSLSAGSGAGAELASVLLSFIRPEAGQGAVHGHV